MKVFKSVKFILIFTLFLVMESLLAQTVSYDFVYNPSKQDLQCIKNTVSESQETFGRVSKEECLNNYEKLNTSVQFMKGPDDRCYAFVDTHPYYFAGEISNSSPCQTEDTDDVSKTINYSELYIENICTELGNCLTTLNERSQELVDNTIEILKDIKIEENFNQLNARMRQDQSSFELANFLEQLDRLETQNSLCQSSLKYGTGDKLAARRSLAEDLEKLSGTLDDDLYVFHWYNGLIQTLANDADGNSPALARRYARRLQDNYFSYDLGGTGLQGRGLYAAQSPQATSNYGKNLLKIRIPAGSKYLDLKTSNIPLSKETRNALSKVDCHFDRSNPHVDHYDPNNGTLYVNKKAFSTDFSCKKVYNDVIKAEGYAFHTYAYFNVYNPICSEITSTAFVLIQNEMTKENVTAFRRPFDRDSSEMEGEARDLYNLDHKVYPNLSSEEEQKRLREKYRDHLWNCN